MSGLLRGSAKVALVTGVVAGSAYGVHRIRDRRSAAAEALLEADPPDAGAEDEAAPLPGPPAAPTPLPGPPATPSRLSGPASAPGRVAGPGG